MGKNTHFLQIWIEPNEMGVPPSFEQITVGDDQKQGRLRLVAAPGIDEGVVNIHADAPVCRSVRRRGACRAEDQPARKAYVHLIRGLS